MRRSEHEFSHRVRPQGIAARIIEAALLGSLTTGCTGWPGLYGSGAHLKGNPFDQAISLLIERETAMEARKRLLKRFPIGRPTAELRRYLETIGASCGSGPGSPVVCRYSQYLLVGKRGIIGDERREYIHHDFTIRMWPSQGPIAKLTVCETLSVEVERGPMILSNHPKPRESKFKPCV